MERRTFIKSATVLGLSFPFIKSNLQQLPTVRKQSLNNKIAPLAITMWDFSWLERRWPGAGYENWDKILDELKERGYNSVRIDAYPHLVFSNPDKIWTLIPHWSVQDWGSPDINKVQIQPNLNEFISKCKDRGIWVALSTWYREDQDNLRGKINSSEIMAEQWIKTIYSIEKDGLLDSILYVDLCNEWPGDAWAPFFNNNPPELTWGGWFTEKSMIWMKTSVEIVREAYPELPLTYSFGDIHQPEKMKELDLSFCDFFEPHIWMVQANNGEFYKKCGYKYDLFKPDSYKALVENGEKLYRSKPEYWGNELKNLIKTGAEIGKHTKTPLITTECWGVVDSKDWPLLNWDWIKELCELGTSEAAETGLWAAMATSNFCGPQFVGMWRDVNWHLKLTNKIESAKIDEELYNSLLVKRISS